MRNARLHQEDQLPPHILDYCEQLTSTFWENIELLHRDSGHDELTASLYDWAIVQGVLALDVFESVCVLLNIKKTRAANMVARSLVDYDVRLRYYIVQSIKPRRGFERCPEEPIERFKEQIHAIQDWENADCELIRRVMNLYDPEDWTLDERAFVDKVTTSGETILGRNFSMMIEYLRANEAKILGVLPRLRDVDREYRNIKPNWHMQSAFLHGSQAIVTDVLEHIKGTRTGTVFRHAPGNFSRTILFTAITHMTRLIHSFSILRGWALGDFQFEKALPDLWFSWSPEAVIPLVDV